MTGCREEDLRPRAVAERALREARKLCGGSWRLRSGVLVAVEGIDGAGVSTTAEALARVLSGLASRACYTKEPTYGPVGFLIWQALSGGYLEPLRLPQLLGLLFAADRLWHLTAEPVGDKRGILECLSEPAVVVSDRYKYSSMAYQRLEGIVAGRRVPGSVSSWLAGVNAYAPPAHFLVYIHVPVDTALERIGGERWALHLYERRRYLEGVQRSFREILGMLRESPEVPWRGPEPPWASLLRAWGLEPDAIYPSGPYPIVVELDGTAPLSENIAETACQLLEEAESRGITERS